MDDFRLVKIDVARQALAEAHSFIEVKEIRDKAAAMQHYLRQHAGSLEAQNYAAELKIRAERRLGELLKEKVGHSGGSPFHDERDLPSEISYIQSHRWQTIAGLPEEDFEQELAEKKAHGEEITTASVYRLARHIENEKAQTAVREQPAVVPAGRYRCIVIDPPWPMKKIEREARPRQVGFEYPTMTEEELQLFPIPHLAEMDCHLYLWTTHKFLPMALRLSEYWGFRYQCLLTWVKNIGFTPFSWMYSTEHILFCRQGNLDLLVKGKRLDFQAKVREHSRKPDEFYDLIKTVSPAPRIDIFSRESREGFATYGNEAGKFSWQQAG